MPSAQQPRQTVEEYNPCAPWKFCLKRWTWRWRLKPDYVIIGAQKGGTTSLHQYLLLHPQVCSAYHKEIHFFDVNFHKRERWYRTHFPLYRPVLSGARKLVGDSTPYYFFHPLAPERAASLYPELKLMCLLRNPVDRAFSHFQHNRRKGRENRSFLEACQDEERWLADETRNILEQPDYYSEKHRHFSYVSRGIYIDQLMRWHDCFPKEQLLILESGDFYRDTARSVSKACEFLGLSPLESDHFEAKNKQSYPEPMESDTRKWLEEYYRPHNEKLASYLGRDFGW